MFLRKFILLISHERRGRGLRKNQQQQPARHGCPDNPCPDLRCKPKVKDTLPAGVTAATSVPDLTVPCHSCPSEKPSAGAFLNEFVNSRLHCGCAPAGYIPAWIPAFQIPPDPVRWERHPANACLPPPPSLANWGMPTKSSQTARDCN